MLTSIFVSLAFGQLASASGVGMSHTIIAASGATSPTGGKYVQFLHASLNSRPEVAFDAILSGPNPIGVFVGDGRTTVPVALGGSRDSLGNTLFSAIDPFVTPIGQVVFIANGNSIYTGDGRDLMALVRNGDPAPGGGKLTLPVPYAANDSGAVGYAANVLESSATRGIFRTDGSGTVAITRDDVDPPTGGRFTLLAEPVISNRGDVAFFAAMTDGTADYGIFRGDGGDLVPVFFTNQFVPDVGTFSDFGNPVINARAQVATKCLLTSGASGLFVSDGTNVTAIAVAGLPAPSGGNYESFLGPLRLNERGEVAIHASLTGAASASGVFVGNGTQTTTVALDGADAPGTTGRFELFSDIQLADDGRVAFIATLAAGVGDVDLSNNMGIWVGTSEKDLRLVVRTGETVDGNVLSALPMGASSGEFDVNQNALVWIGSFQSLGRAVVFSRAVGDG